MGQSRDEQGRIPKLVADSPLAIRHVDRRLRRLTAFSFGHAAKTSAFPAG
jgi:hypothetical protein